MDLPGAVGPDSGELVGRENELAKLARAFDAAGAGQRRLVLVEGEPGIGKTRLVSEAVASARSRGWRALWGRAWDDAGAPAFWPWTQVLRAWIRSSDADVVQPVLGEIGSDLAQIVPDVATFAGPSHRPQLDDPDAARFRLFDDVATVLSRIAQRSSIVVVLDDLHAADSASLLLLRFIARQQLDVRLLIIGTYRSVGFSPSKTFETAISEVGRAPDTSTISLTGIDKTAVGRLLVAAMGADDPDVANVVWRETRGNPLFVTEAAKLLASAGQLRDARSVRVVVPTGVHEAILGGVVDLPPSTLELLRIAAALGPEFAVDVLARVANVTASDTVQRLIPAAEARLIESSDPTETRFRFTHDLVRDVVYADIKPADRTALHRRIAHELEGFYGEALGDHLAEVARHFQYAGVEARRSAIDYARRAAVKAADALAYEEAARLFGIALDILSSTPEGDESERADLLLELGDALARAGEPDRARGLFRDAASIANKSQNPRQLALAALGYGGRLIWTRAGRDMHLLDLLQDALSINKGSTPLRVRLLARLACAWRSDPNRRSDSDVLSAEALAIARRIGDPESLAFALVGRFWAIYWPDNAEERLALARELLVTAENARDPERALDGRRALLSTLLDLGLVDEARNELERLRDSATELHQPTHVVAGQAYDAVLALLEGSYEVTERLVEAELAIERPINAIRDEVSTTTIHLFLLRREQARVGEVEAHVRAAAGRFPWYPFHKAALVCLLADVGRTEEAQARFKSLARDSFATLYRDCEWLFGMALATDACAILGDGAAATVLYEQLVEFKGQHAVGHAEGSLGSVDRYLGLLASTRGQLDLAERHLTDSIALNDALGAWPWTAHAQKDLASVLFQRGRPTDADRTAQLLASAQATADRLGMTALSRQIDGIARSDGAGATAPPTAVEPRSAQFKREGDYWTLGYGGKTVRIRDSKGMRYLARLLAEPNRDFHVLDLVGSSTGAGRRSAANMAQSPSTGAEAGFGDAGELLDPQARDAYRDRLTDLETEIAEAEDWHDSERAARLIAERDFLVRELAAAVGLGGRTRVASSAAERARLSVGKSIRSSMQRIGEQNSSLGRHLSLSVRTGTFCVYRPDPELDVRWQL